jgi:succinate-semialdehyde dehydrogenase/glutarate-semialdehyde dehydrogenase
MRECASTVKKVSLELGGNAPFLVFDDADVSCAVDALIKAKFRNAGQVCIAADRVFIQEGIYKEFCDKLVDKVKSDVVLGRGTDPKSTIGPLINKSALEKSQKHVDDAVEKGARVLIGGKTPSENEEGGMFFEPTVLADVTCDMLAISEETFGPVCPLMSFKTEEDAIEMANDSK